MNGDADILGLILIIVIFIFLGLHGENCTHGNYTLENVQQCRKDSNWCSTEHPDLHKAVFFPESNATGVN